jgi:isopentenyl-diphosphate delta-isomerase
MDEAVDRRLREELGLASELVYLFKFQYQARYEDIGSENEMCWVYLGIADGPAVPNPHEIADLSWVTSAELDERITRTPEEFTPWFRLEWPRVRDAFRSTLGL